MGIECPECKGVLKLVGKFLNTSIPLFYCVKCNAYFLSLIGDLFRDESPDFIQMIPWLSHLLTKSLTKIDKLCLH